MLKKYVDVVIIGAGAAGMYCGAHLSKNLSVLIMSKESLDENNSILAQGGIAACTKAEDTFEMHISDTTRAGSHLNNLENLAQMVKSAPNEINRLIDIGVEFDRGKEGEVLTTMEGGHSKRRILHCGGDATGKEIVRALKKYVSESQNIEIWENTMAIELIEEMGNCTGVKVISDDKLIEVYAKNTVIASGGIGGIYKNTTNSHVNTGDGIAMAVKAGVEVGALEFVQFHPTAFYSREKGKKFLISEAVRGEGAILLNKRGEAFMKKYSELKDLAPRDVVSKAIFREMRLTKSSFVYLDIRHRSRTYLKNRFPTIFEECLKENIDMSKDLIPVVPVEHYLVGGIKTDAFGQTSMKYLYACGECADTGVHGANRLASNSLLECIVFGRICAENINKQEHLNEKEEAYLNIKRTVNLGSDLEKEREEIKEIMDKYMGIVRTKEGMKKALRKIENILKKLKLNYSLNKNYMGVYNMAICSKAIIEQAMNRSESVGCHFVIDEVKESKKRGIL